MNRSKWNINKVEAKATGTGAHITLPKSWLKKMVVVVTKDTWKELQQK